MKLDNNNFKLIASIIVLFLLVWIFPKINNYKPTTDAVANISEPAPIITTYGTRLLKGGATATEALEEYIVIENLDNNLLYVNGLTISNSKGDIFKLGKSVELFKQGSINELNNSIFPIGAEIIVSTGRSPIGVSFRQNICSGYLEEYQRFVPNISFSCPNPKEIGDKFSYEISKSCRDFLPNLLTCRQQVPLESIPKNCEEEIESILNYNSCVEGFRKNSNFKDNIWRIYLKQDEEIWGNESERITLFFNDEPIGFLEY